MIKDKTYDEILNFMQVTNKKLTKVVDYCEVQMAEKMEEQKTVTIVDMNGDKENLSITEDGKISIEGDWLVVYYSDGFALAGFQIAHVKSWWISL